MERITAEKTLTPEAETVAPLQSLIAMLKMAHVQLFSYL